MTRRLLLASCALAVMSVSAPAAVMTAEPEPADQGEIREDGNRRHHGGWLDRLRGMADHPAVGHGRLGVQVQPMTPELREFLGGPADRGILVARVEADSPAEAAGIEVGDIIVAADGDDVERAHDLVRAVHHAEPGSPLALEIVRERETRTIDVTPDQPEVASHECDAGDCPHARPFGLPFPLGGGDLGERLDQIEERLEQLEKRVLPGMEGAERAT